MRFTAKTLESLCVQLEREFDRLNDPKQPTKLWSVVEADLPPAADWVDHLVWITDLAVCAVSDGTDWIGLDTGSPI